MNTHTHTHVHKHTHTKHTQNQLTSNRLLYTIESLRRSQRAYANQQNIMTTPSNRSFVAAVLLIIIITIICVRAQLPNYFTNQDVSEGQAFPPHMNVIVGETLYVRIQYPVAGQTRCAYRQPRSSIDITVPATAPITNKYINWTSVIFNKLINKRHISITE